jgi:hypothetical protein
MWSPRQEFLSGTAVCSYRRSYQALGGSMRLILVVGALGALGLSLAGCQTAEQSMANAQNVCVESGLRPGTRAYSRCTNANYRNNVAQSNAAANQVAAGAAVAAIGGAAIAASAQPYYCRGWGCW